jgi:hypothetical protein
MRVNCNQIRGTLRTLAQSPLAGALLVFLVALCVRMQFSVAHPHFDNIFAVRGVPFSDGVTWTTAAISLAEGRGWDTYVHRVCRSLWPSSIRGLAIPPTPLLF